MSFPPFGLRRSKCHSCVGPPRARVARLASTRCPILKVVTFALPMGPCRDDVAESIAWAALEPELRPEAIPPAAPPADARHDQSVRRPGNRRVLGFQRDLGFLPNAQDTSKIVLRLAVAHPYHS